MESGAGGGWCASAGLGALARPAVLAGAGRPGRPGRPGRRITLAFSRVLNLITVVGWSSRPAPASTISRPVAPSRRSTGRARSSSVPAAAPLIASTSPPGRASPAARPARRSRLATARAVTTSASISPASSSARPRRTRALPSPSCADALLQEDGPPGHRLDQGHADLRQHDREHDSRQASTRAEIGKLERLAARRRRYQLGDHPAVQQVPVPRAPGLAGADQAALDAGPGEQFRVRLNYAAAASRTESRAAGGGSGITSPALSRPEE